MREAGAALGLGGCIQPVQRRGERGGLVLREDADQIFIERRFDLRLGGLQSLRLFRRVQQPAAPVAGCVPADKIPLRFKIFRPPRNGGLVRVQKLRERGLRAAGVMAQRVDQIDLCRADALLPQREQHQLLRFPRDLGDLPFRNVHRRLRRKE